MAIKELTATQSINLVKDLLKTNKKKLSESDFKPGNFIMFNYDALDKTQTYDRTPLNMILKRGRSHTLMVAFHWAPMPLRLNLIKKIFMDNKKNIKAGKPLEMDYQKFKPYLKLAGFSPIIRLYINKRISSSGVIIPQDRLLDIARTKSETFTQGKVSAEQLYGQAIQKYKTHKITRKRREL